MSDFENLTIKQPIRRLEIQINNFNVAIPHHVDLLQRYRSNIKKYQDQRDWERIQREHANVSRIIKQLKELLYQMDTLRAQVLDSDIEQFDKLTAKARTSIMDAIREYLDMELNLWLSPPSSPDQKEMVVNTEKNVEETQVNVKKGSKFLEKALRYKAAAYPLAGAVLGTCIGGPIGLIAGLKIGGLTALGCGILGFTGGSLLKKKHIDTYKFETSNESVADVNNVKKSTSCPENLEMDKKQL
ncbi:syntaxin-17 isoform X2 [Harpegnathos saltator]|uniref:syntaxin-17 isoform X2 n=1 Tax=Harpegnathos saltator TaxID=610380 RepID=UPI000DBEDC9E|nr:syntaxin-17 isoform X2 [Harpegnathos saltator]